MILAGLAFGGVMVLMAGAASVLYLHFHPRCTDQVLSESTSPEGQWTAALMERRCGEESPFFYHVNLRPAAEPIRLAYFSGRADEGEIFRIEEYGGDTEPILKWSAPRQLTITCPRCGSAQVQKREEHWGPITVGYRLQP
jgi:hypothetical protein